LSCQKVLIQPADHGSLQNVVEKRAAKWLGSFFYQSKAVPASSSAERHCWALRRKSVDSSKRWADFDDYLRTGEQIRWPAVLMPLIE
jgi:hypothetical protein